MSRRKKSRGRDVHGVLLLDKPAGLTSNEALQKVKRLFNARKAGHTGSLDRGATGLLPLCFGEATKFSSFLLEADKHYLALCRLGRETATGDAEGEVVSEAPVPDLDRARIEAALSSFRGAIKQVPPMYSALKHKGKRLYELAYQGLEVEREPREVVVHELTLVKFGGDELLLDVHCSKGTYIRTLAEDIGRALGCGAHIGRLRRTGTGPFREEEMITMEELEQLDAGGPAALDASLLSVDTVIREMPEVEMAETVAYYLKQGQPVIIPHAPTEGLLRIYTDTHVFLGVGEVLDDGRIAPRRLINP
ncbi:MAG: tRNA pseudouridine(55) synthase TruB [Gammaproteobacteria bacterium]